MAKKTISEREKKAMREARMEPMTPHADVGAALVMADLIQQTNGRSLTGDEMVMKNELAQADRAIEGAMVEGDLGEMLVKGEAYVIFTPAITLVGRLVAMSAWELKLEDASWVADTGRYHQAFRQGFSQGINSEVEPCGKPIVVSRGAIIYCVPYPHALPTDAI